MRPSKLPVNECSQAMYPTKTGYSFGYDTPRANHLKRHLANESSPQCNTVTKLMHEILSRCTVMKYVHEVYSTMIAKVSRNSNKCKTNRCNLATECIITNADERVFVVALARFRCRFCTKSLLSLFLRRPCKSFAIDMNLPCSL